MPYHYFQTIRLTSTPGSILKFVISFTTLDGQWISMTLLWILISNLSQVLDPSPQGVFLVVILKIFVGIRTGPLVSKSWFLALETISAQAASSGFTSLLLRVILKGYDGKGGIPDSLDFLMYFFSLCFIFLVHLY